MTRSLTRALLLTAAAVGLVALPLVAQESQRFVRYEQGSSVFWGEVVGQTIHQLTDAPYLGGARTGATASLNAVSLRAPVDPRQIFMTAFNFRSHITGEPAEEPGLFLVPPSSVIGPDEDIVRPRGSRNLHYEAEMVVVVGREGADIPLGDAGDYVFGVAAGNDVSERDWQAADLQWSRAKGSRTFNVVGPHLVTGLDYMNLEIEGRYKGETVQGENTADMVFSVDFMLHYISQHFTLYPGDLIWTGTMGTTQAMEPGDSYEVEVEGVGVLRNTVVQGR